MTPSGTISSPARLQAVKRLSSSVLLHEYRHAAIARHARPGQFVQMQTSPGLEPFFRRPMSIFGADSRKGVFTVVFAVVGKGTRCLARARVGDELSVVGPLGNWFILPRGCTHAVLVAGGVGLPPVDFWARNLVGSKKPASRLRVTLLIGARSDRERIRVPAVPGVQRAWSTDDGSFGFRGTVIDLLRKRQQEEDWPVAGTAVYGCGPIAMLKALQAWMIEHGYWGQLSLEGLMPCGFGVCSGCVVRSARAEEGYEKFLRMCHDGPVFDVAEVSL